MSLGPEMKSTGEVMGMDSEFGPAFLKSQYGTEFPVPKGGKALMSIADRRQRRRYHRGSSSEGVWFFLCVHPGTATVLKAAGIDATLVGKVHEDGRRDITDLIRNHEISLVINTSEEKKSIRDSVHIRLAALQHNIPPLHNFGRCKCPFSRASLSDPRRSVQGHVVARVPSG